MFHQNGSVQLWKSVAIIFGEKIRRDSVSILFERLDISYSSISSETLGGASVGCEVDSWHSSGEGDLFISSG